MKAASKLWRPVLVALFVGLVLLLIIGPRRSGPVCLSPATGQEPIDAIPVAWLFGRNAVSQSVSAAYDGLSAVSWRIDDPPAVGALSVTLEQVGQGTGGNGWSAQVSGNGGAYTLSFPAQPESAGRDYRLTLRAVDVPVGERIAVWLSPHDVFPGELELNGASMAADLALQLCYAPRSIVEQGYLLAIQLRSQYHVVDTIIDRMSQYKPFYFKRPQLIGLLTLNLLALAWLAFHQGSRLLLRRPWSLGRSFVWSFWLCLATAVLFISVGLWGGSRDQASVLPAEPAALLGQPGPDDQQAYDFALAAMLEQEMRVDAPEAWYIAPDWAAIGDDWRPILKMHPPSSASFQVSVPDSAQLRGAMALSPDVWSPDKGDGVQFQILIAGPNGETLTLDQLVDPKHDPEQRRWNKFEVDLSLFAGMPVTITFQTLPVSSADWDWAMWGGPVMISTGQ